MNPDATLSAVVLTRNSSALLERCLQSLKFADELIVIDDFSTDETAEISVTHSDILPDGLGHSCGGTIYARTIVQ